MQIVALENWKLSFQNLNLFFSSKLFFFHFFLMKLAFLFKLFTLGGWNLGVNHILRKQKKVCGWVGLKTQYSFGSL